MCPFLIAAQVFEFLQLVLDTSQQNKQGVQEKCEKVEMLILLLARKFIQRVMHFSFLCRIWSKICSCSCHLDQKNSFLSSCLGLQQASVHHLRNHQSIPLILKYMDKGIRLNLQNDSISV